MDSASQTLLVIAGCLVLSAFFSGSETALVRLRASDLDRNGRGAHDPATVATRALLRSTPRLLVTILVGNNVVNLLAAALASALAVRQFGEAIGVPLATIVLTILVLVFSEVLPKAFSARHPQRVAQVVSLPLYLLHQLLRPVHVAFDRVVEPVVRWLGGGAEVEHASTAEDLLRLARAAELHSGTPTPASIIGGVARAAEMHVSDIMVPRTEIVAFPVSTAPAALLERMLEERYTRVPIYEDSIDHMLGVIHLKDLIGAVRSGATDLAPILKPLLRVPERKEILSLLADMQRAFAHLAVVKDEFGVTLGLVTQEDILEEIVGEIRDEFDRDELLTIRTAADGSHQAVGRLKVIDFNRETGWDVPAERGDTLSGLVFNELGRAPRKGDSVRVPGYLLTVVDVSGSRITEVRVERRAPPPEEPEEARNDSPD
jgi:CBS domain containing-hemolysin-like protein